MELFSTWEYRTTYYWVITPNLIEFEALDYSIRIASRSPLRATGTFPKETGEKSRNRAQEHEYSSYGGGAVNCVGASDITSSHWRHSSEPRYINAVSDSYLLLSQYFRCQQPSI